MFKFLKSDNFKLFGLLKLFFDLIAVLLPSPLYVILLAMFTHIDFRNHELNFLPIFREDFETRCRCLKLSAKRASLRLYVQRAAKSRLKTYSKYRYFISDCEYCCVRTQL